MATVVLQQRSSVLYVVHAKMLQIVQGSAERTPRFPSYAPPKLGSSFCHTLYKQDKVGGYSDRWNV
jgi:hypothetical protein